MVRMLETKCVGDNYNIWVKFQAIFVANIDDIFTYASGTNIQKMSPTFTNRHQL